MAQFTRVGMVNHHLADGPPASKPVARRVFYGDPKAMNIEERYQEETTMISEFSNWIASFLI